MKNAFERGINIVLVLAAVALTGTVIHREFVSKNPQLSASRPEGPPQYLDDWRQMASRGVLLAGLANAPVQIMEFADFECPFCRNFDATARRVQARYPSKVSRVFVHFPLEMHRFARLAATAAECAAKEGRFAQMHDILFANQDSLGLKSWATLGSEAGIRDTTAFGRCVVSPAGVPRIEEGIELAERLGLHGTPTVIVNGWEFAAPPSDSLLSKSIDSLLRGRLPPGAQEPKSARAAGE